MFSLPVSFSQFSDHFDRMVDDLLDDPWGRSQASLLESQAESPGVVSSCLCGGNDNYDEGYDTSEQTDRDCETSDSLRYTQDSGVHAQQAERNTRIDTDERRVESERRHQHKVQRRHQPRNVHEHNLGDHPSNQPPTVGRNNMQRANLRRQVEVQNNQVPGDESRRFNRMRRDSPQARTHSDERFHGTMPNNRDSHVADPHSHQSRLSTKPVQVYSLQVPGYKPRELQVQTEGRTVRVKGRRACGCQDSCAIKEFERVFTLPESVDKRHLQATLNKEGTFSVQVNANQRLSSRGHFEDRDIVVEGLDLPPIEDNSENTENCVKKASMKLAKINKHTGKRVPVSRPSEELPVRNHLDNDYYDDEVTIESIDEWNMFHLFYEFLLFVQLRLGKSLVVSRHCQFVNERECAKHSVRPKSAGSLNLPSVLSFAAS